MIFLALIAAAFEAGGSDTSATTPPTPVTGRCAVDAFACVPEADNLVRSVFPPLTNDATPAGMKARWRTIAAWSGAVPDDVLKAHGKPTWAETVALYQTACDAGISLGCTSVAMAWSALGLLSDERQERIEQETRAAYRKACALKDDHGCLQVLLSGVLPPDDAGPSIPVLCGRGWDDACNAGR
jgi:hypothetical protein